jgi:hypothetical protein
MASIVQVLPTLLAVHVEIVIFLQEVKHTFQMQ